MLDINKNELIPGALYAVLEYTGFDNEVAYGSLVRYGSNGTLYCVDYDDSEDIDPYYDELVPQNSGIDKKFV